MRHPWYRANRTIPLTWEKRELKWDLCYVWTSNSIKSKTVCVDLLPIQSLFYTGNWYRHTLKLIQDFRNRKKRMTCVLRATNYFWGKRIEISILRTIQFKSWIQEFIPSDTYIKTSWKMFVWVEWNTHRSRNEKNFTVIKTIKEKSWRNLIVTHILWTIVWNVLANERLF